MPRVVCMLRKNLSRAYALTLADLEALHKQEVKANVELSPVWLNIEGVLQNPCRGTSLVAQWLRIHLSMQGTRVRALVREGPTCYRATKPVCHNY